MENRLGVLHDLCGIFLITLLSTVGEEDLSENMPLEANTGFREIFSPIFPESHVFFVFFVQFLNIL